MNLEQAIHLRWAATNALADLLPAERVKTGRSLGHAVPYLTLARTSSKPALSSNSGDSLDEVVLRFDLWHDDHDLGRAIVEQIEIAFHRVDFSLAGQDRVVSMRRVDRADRQHDDGVWQFTVEFLVLLLLPYGG